MEDKLIARLMESKDPNDAYFLLPVTAKQIDGLKYTKLYANMIRKEILKRLPNSRAGAIAITKLDEAILWFYAGLVGMGPQPPETTEVTEIK